MQEIITPRLSLRLMTADFLEASLAKDAATAESIIGLKISDDWFDEQDIIRIRLNDYRNDAEYISWGLHAISLRETCEMIGFIGFHSLPDPEYLQMFAPNAIEFGYTIFFLYRRQGFASEAISSFLHWAIRKHPLDNFIASVSPANIASTALIKKLGFEKVGEQLDETDGLEFVYSMAVEKIEPINFS